MLSGVSLDFSEMEQKLKHYVDHCRVTVGSQVKEEPLISVKPDLSLVRPLDRVTTYMGSFIAVDCSTRTIKRANNWGVYLMRVHVLPLKNERSIGVTKSDFVQ